MISIEQSSVRQDIWFLKISKEGDNYSDLTVQLSEQGVAELFKACAKTAVGQKMLKRFKDK